MLMAAPVATADGPLPPALADALTFAESQVNAMLADLGYATAHPDWATAPAVFPKVTTADSADRDWQFTTVNSGNNWGAGYTPGLMWELAALTANPVWADRASAWSDPIAKLATIGGDMQMNLGFHFMNSFAPRIAYVGPSAEDFAVLDTASQHATTAWMPEIGSFYSFTWNSKLRYDGLQGGFAAHANTIIDSAPNLELIWYQAKRLNDTQLWEMGRSHLANLLAHNLRPDGSTAQVAAYDLEERSFIGNRGHQGYGPDSTWSRGQGWALHGFATAWAHNAHPALPEAFHRAFEFYAEHAPADGVPFWDFQAPHLSDAQLEFRYPGKNATAIRLARDSSAAALAASALLLASHLTDSDARAWQYFSYAESILLTLAQPGFLAVDDRGQPTKSSILAQGSYTFPGVDKGQIWGDFYFVQALRRYRDLVAPPAFSDAPIGDLAQFHATQGRQHWRALHHIGRPALHAFAPTARTHIDPSRFLLHRAPTQSLAIQFASAPDATPDATQAPAAILVFDFLNRNDFKFIRLRHDDADSGVFHHLNGSTTTLATFQPPTNPNPATDPTSFAFLRNPDGIQLTANDTLLLSLTAEPITGKWGFTTQCGSAFFFITDAVTDNLPDAPSPFTLFLNTHLQHLHPLQRLPLADPDADGRPNLLEFALNSDPATPNPAPHPQLNLHLQHSPSLALHFDWLSTQPNIHYLIDQSTDGGHSWHPFHTATYATQAAPNPVPIPSTSALFRIRIATD